MTSIASPAPFFGRRVVAAAFVLAVFGWGLGFYGPPVYLQSVREARDWSVVLVSSAVTLHFLVGAVVVANLPTLYRRFGLPSVTKTGAVLLAFGVLGWALAREPWQLLIATFLSGAGWVAMGAAAVNAIVAPWYALRRPAALSMAYNGASIGGVVFSPLWVAAIASWGFPIAAAVVGAVMVATVWFLADRVFAHTPQSLGQMQDGGILTPSAGTTVPVERGLPGGSLWRDRRFLTLAAAMALGLFAQIGLIAHLFSLLVPVFGGPVAGILMGLATAAAIAGRTLVGWLMPQGSDRRLVACASHLVQIAGSVALLFAAGTDVVLLVAGVLLFGAGIGNTTSLPPLIAQVEFSKADAQRVVPLIVAIGQGAYAFAPAVFGGLRTLSPAEGMPVFVAAALVQAAAIALFLLGRRT
ncbi:MFS transporter [Reyranella sp. MMS21-HV4-11]|uniref:MFS transporter n=1 Tax=Reyranella humidisoli TaxID=2849149 RepID=A0ABS6IK48_9HYPH|nr:MFS transporter [Reyranella sp. MMS21-HV4-11]MBU8874370.1 MFS transporter [Reyranella sp. MMS21-HV4-11]